MGVGVNIYFLMGTKIMNSLFFRNKITSLGNDLQIDMSKNELHTRN